MADNYYQMRLRQYNKTRKTFTIKVYLIAVLFLIISFVQWLLMYFVKPFRNFFEETTWVAILFLLIALVLITMFIFIEKLRFKIPINWIFVLIIVEMVTLGLALAVSRTKIEVFGYAFALTLIITIVFICIGMFIKRDLTLDIVILFVVGVILFVGSVFFALLHIMIYLKYTFLVYAISTMLIVVIFLMYHAQAIAGGRYAEMRLKDFLLGSLIIYNDFIIIFMIILYFLAFAGVGGRQHWSARAISKEPPNEHSHGEFPEHLVDYRRARAANSLDYDAVDIDTYNTDGIYAAEDNMLDESQHGRKHERTAKSGGKQGRATQNQPRNASAKKNAKQDAVDQGGGAEEGSIDEGNRKRDTDQADEEQSNVGKNGSEQSEYHENVDYNGGRDERGVGGYIIPSPL